jgi:hypothetical protein
VPLLPVEADAGQKDTAAPGLKETAVVTHAAPAKLDGRSVEAWLKVTSREVKGRARPIRSCMSNCG